MMMKIYNVFSVVFLAEIIRMIQADFPPSTCQPVTCLPPTTKPNLKLTCSNGGFWFGTVCEAKCYPGFQLIGGHRAVCKGNGIFGFWESETESSERWNPECAPTTCDDVQNNGMVRIHPKPYVEDGIEVYCEDSHHVDGRWIVIQRRINGSVDFYRTYDEYVNGFGNKNGEFWLGLEYIHQLTSVDEYDLLVELEDFDGNKAYETYSKFFLGDSSTKYTLHAQKDQGTAEDALTYSVGQQFSTYDSDNDKSSSNCAKKYQGAWWYNDCHHANLNGRYYDTEQQDKPDGIVWKQWKNYKYLTLKSATMKIRMT